MRDPKVMLEVVRGVPKLISRQPALSLASRASGTRINTGLTSDAIQYLSLGDDRFL